MSEETKTPEAEPRRAAGAASEAGAGAPAPQASNDPAPSGGAEEAALLAAKMEALEKERDSLKDQLFRALAETDNIRKRAEREKAETAKFAIVKFAQDIVGVGDSFQHAIAAVPPDAAEKDAALKSFLDGVTIAERSFLAALERHGVTRIDPAGEIFSPHRHHAVSEEQNPDLPPGSITKVYQTGYLIEDRVLRPAMVVVARGGKKQAAGGAAEPANENTAPASEAGAPPPEPGPPAAGGEEKAG